MAEFKDVMKQWRRFCKSHNNCGECEFDGKGICGEAHLTDIPYADIELRIMAWAAEHPEPVYPNWVEWLIDKGVIPQEGCMLATVHDPDTGKITEARIGINPSALQPIPADIAKKLGIEPKEAR